jgi:hypothetical protein
LLGRHVAVIAQHPDVGVLTQQRECGTR